LVADGLIDRRAAPKDRRSQIVSLTAEGRRAFRAMARTHENWIAEIFGELSASDIDTLMKMLAKAKTSTAEAIGAEKDR
jgi:DNA-binding MarR family transcriptional regulator